MSATLPADQTPKLYDDDGDRLLEADNRSDRVVMLPSGDPRRAVIDRDRVRIQWGQHLLADLLARRYRPLVCGVNSEDNSHGIIGQLAAMLPTSQWNPHSITAHAQTFAKSIGKDEVLVLKYDLDAVEVMALLRPVNRDYFTLDDLGRGFRKISQMLEGRFDRIPCASVSFLGAKSNRLVNDQHQEPTFEAVLRTMFTAGYRGDVYPSLRMWELAPTGVFANYPFPESLDTMRQGGY